MGKITAVPYKNSIKLDRADVYYHVYSRGQNKRTVFADSKDFYYFLDIFSRYLDPSFKKYAKLNDQVSMHCFCLMPNHFHLLLKVKFPGGMGRLMRRVLTSYSIYFNRKNNREGKLFQGAYRAIPILDEQQLVNTSIYIHLNPVTANISSRATEYPYSSCYMYHKNLSHISWLEKDPIITSLVDWKNIESYKEIVNEDSPWK